MLDDRSPASRPASRLLYFIAGFYVLFGANVLIAEAVALFTGRLYAFGWRSRGHWSSLPQDDPWWWGFWLLYFAGGLAFFIGGARAFSRVWKSRRRSDLAPSGSLTGPMKRLLVGERPAATLLGYAFLPFLIGALAALFLDFDVSDAALAPPAALLAAVASLVFIVLFRRARQGATPAAAGYPQQIKVRPAWAMLAAGVLLPCLFFLVFYITLPALWTEAFGTGFVRQDLVSKIEECNRRRSCAFCRFELSLQRHSRWWGEGYFCLSREAAAGMKAGDRVVITGYGSPLGERFTSFTPLQ